MSCSKYDVSDLRDRVTIEQKSRVADGYGGWVTTFSELATVWAKVDAMTANEMKWADKMEHRVTHKVIIRRRTDVTADMRLTFGTSVMNIKGVRQLENDKRWTELTCEEGSPA